MDTEDAEGKDHRGRSQGPRCCQPTVSDSTLRLHNGKHLHWKTEKMGSKRDDLMLPNQQKLESEFEPEQSGESLLTTDTNCLLDETVGTKSPASGLWIGKSVLWAALLHDFR